MSEVNKTPKIFKYSEVEIEKVNYPCIFCQQRSAILISQEIDGVPEADDVYFVRCNGCYAQGPVSSIGKRAVSAWNDNYISIFGPV